MTFEPMNDKILVRPIAEPEKIGSIFVPDSARSKQRNDLAKGVVVKMGPGMLTKKGERWPMPDVKIGDTILFQDNAAHKINIDGEPHMVIRDDVVYCVIE